MGCDTHMYIEYRKKGNEDWSSYGGRINPGRNYFIFGILAQVRCDTEFSFSPKGLPEKLAYKADQDNRLYISDSDDEGCTTMAKAESWVRSGSSKFINDSNGKPTWVTHPDWHSHSWLTTQEFEKSIEFYRQHENGSKYPEPEYEVLLSSMKRFEELGYDCRVVFWFDN